MSLRRLLVMGALASSMAVALAAVPAAAGAAGPTTERSSAVGARAYWSAMSASGGWLSAEVAVWSVEPSRSVEPSPSVEPSRSAKPARSSEPTANAEMWFHYSEWDWNTGAGTSMWIPLSPADLKVDKKLGSASVDAMAFAYVVDNRMSGLPTGAVPVRVQGEWTATGELTKTRMTYSVRTPGFTSVDRTRELARLSDCRLTVTYASPSGPVDLFAGTTPDGIIQSWRDSIRSTDTSPTPTP